MLESQNDNPIARIVFEHSPDAIFIESLDGTILEVNPAACRLHDMSRDQLVGSSVFDLIPPDEQEAVREQFPLLARGEIDRFEGYSWRTDGTRTPVELQANRISYLGEPALLLIVRDITERVDNAARLRSERDLLRAVIGANPLSVYVLDADGKITFASEQAERLLRLEASDMIGKTYNDPGFDSLGLNGEPIDSRDLPAHSVLAEGREVRGIRHQIRWPDGESRRICVNGSPLCDTKGVMTGGVFVVDDVTLSDRVVEDLRDSRERLELATSVTDMGIWDWHVPSGRVAFNDAWPALVGYTLDEIEPTLEQWEALVHRDDMPRVAEQIDDYFEGKADSYRTEFRMRHRDGQWRWFGAVGRLVERGADGEPLRMVGINFDIDDNKRRALELQASEHRFRELVNSIDPIVWEIALPDWRFTFVSAQQAQRVLDYPVALWYQSVENWIGWIIKEDREWVMEHRRESTAACEDHEMQYRMRAADGSIVWIRDIIKIVTDDDGNPVGLRGVMIDETESRRQSERLRNLLNELDHRVRNNLTSLTSLVDLYKSGGRNTTDMADALRTQIGAMASAHSHIADAHGEPVRLDRLVASLGGTYNGGPNPRLVAQGPPCSIDPARVAVVTIMIQEWITNSRKHGALGSPEGRVRFEWNTAPDNGSPHGLTLRWSESGGPTVRTQPLGVGLTLVRGFVEHELRGDCEFDFDPAGFSCCARLPRIVSSTT